MEFEYEPKTFVYQSPVRKATCADCNGRTISVSRTYKPDIYIGASDIWVEAKGKFTSKNRSSMEDFLRGSPGIDLRFIFMRDNWLTKNHKTKYSDWAKKLGVKYAIGERIPDEWVST